MKSKTARKVRRHIIDLLRARLNKHAPFFIEKSSIMRFDRKGLVGQAMYSILDDLRYVADSDIRRWLALSCDKEIFLNSDKYFELLSNCLSDTAGAKRLIRVAFWRVKICGALLKRFY